eukprot:8337099-Pyramimonas_sp.AAC.1
MGRLHRFTSSDFSECNLDAAQRAGHSWSHGPPRPTDSGPHPNLRPTLGTCSDPRILATLHGQDT